MIFSKIKGEIVMPDGYTMSIYINNIRKWFNIDVTFHSSFKTLRLDLCIKIGSDYKFQPIIYPEFMTNLSIIFIMLVNLKMDCYRYIYEVIYGHKL